MVGPPSLKSGGGSPPVPTPLDTDLYVISVHSLTKDSMERLSFGEAPKVRHSIAKTYLNTQRYHGHPCSSLKVPQNALIPSTLYDRII